MKQLALALSVLACTLLAQAPKATKARAGRVIRCKGADSKPCSENLVNQLADATAGKNQQEVLRGVRSLTLAAPDGTLNCEQNDGSPCTLAQLDAIKILAADRHLYLNYNRTGAK